MVSEFKGGSTSVTDGQKDGSNLVSSKGHRWWDTEGCNLGSGDTRPGLHQGDTLLLL